MSKKSLSSSSRVNILSARTSNSSTYNTSTSNCNKRKLSTINVDDEELMTIMNLIMIMIIIIT